jgi:hypothetical protein
VSDQQPDDLVIALVDEIVGQPIGSGYYATTVDVDAAREMVRAILGSDLILPAADSIPKQAVRDLAQEYERRHHAGTPHAWNTAIDLHQLAATGHA